MMEFLNRELFAGITILHAGLIVGAFLGVSTILTKMGAAQTSNKLLKKRCRNCKWEGPATAATKTCPKCQGPLHAV